MLLVRRYTQRRAFKGHFLLCFPAPNPDCLYWPTVTKSHPAPTLLMKTAALPVRHRGQGAIRAQRQPVKGKVTVMKNLTDSCEYSFIGLLYCPVHRHASISTSRKILRFVDKIAKSKYFQKATENEYIRKKIAEVSNMPLMLTVEVLELSGTLAINIPPPPTDRIWYCFVLFALLT